MLWEAQFGDFVERRPIGDRRVHLFRRSQVGPAQRRRAAAPARPRGPGPRPQLRPHRAVPAAVRRGLHDRGPAVRAERTTSTCCAGTPWTASPGRWWSSRRSRCCATVRWSPVDDFTEGGFREVIDDPRFRDQNGPAAGVTTLLLCSGKIFWELAAARDKLQDRTTPRSSGSSSSTRCRTARSPPSSSATPTPTTCAGCRRSRPTRAHGPTSAWNCPRSCPSASPGSPASPAGGWPHPRRGRRRSTRSNRRRSSTRLWVRQRTDQNSFGSSALRAPPRVRIVEYEGANGLKRCFTALFVLAMVVHPATGHSGTHFGLAVPPRSQGRHPPCWSRKH